MKHLGSRIGTMPRWVEGRIRGGGRWALQDGIGAKQLVILASAETLPSLMPWIAPGHGLLAGSHEDEIVQAVIWCDYNLMSFAHRIDPAITIVDDERLEIRDALGASAGDMVLLDPSLAVQFHCRLGQAPVEEIAADLADSLARVSSDWSARVGFPVVRLHRAAEAEQLEKQFLGDVGVVDLLRQLTPARRGPGGAGLTVKQQDVASPEVRMALKAMVEAKLVAPLRRYFQFVPMQIVGQRYIVLANDGPACARTIRLPAPADKEGGLFMTVSLSLLNDGPEPVRILFPEFEDTDRPITAGTAKAHAPAITRRLHIPSGARLAELIAWLRCPMPVAPPNQDFMRALASELSAG